MNAQTEKDSVGNKFKLEAKFEVLLDLQNDIENRRSAEEVSNKEYLEILVVEAAIERLINNITTQIFLQNIKDIRPISRFLEKAKFPRPNSAINEALFYLRQEVARIEKAA